MILQSCAKQKSPSPDGWGLELFIHLLEMMILDLLAVAEESLTHGNISGAINATFISLISKNPNLTTFGYYRPISLCNSSYMMISKMISIKLKNTLSLHISPK